MVSRIVASPVGNSARKITPDRLVLLIRSGTPDVSSATGRMMSVAASNPAAANEVVFTGGQSLVMIDPMA